MNRLLLLILLLATARLGHSAGVTVKPDLEWHPATEAQVKALTGQPGYEVVDFSLHTNGGAGTVLRSPVSAEINQPFVEGSIRGFLGSIHQSSPAAVERHLAKIGVLPGVCLSLTSESNGNAYGLVSYLLFSKDAMYAVTVYGPRGLKSTDPLVVGYVARIEMDATLVPSDLETSSAYTQGQATETRTGRFLGYVVGAAVIILGSVVFFRRRLETKPPTAPR